MSQPRTLIPFVCWTVLGLLLGGAGAVVLPKQYASIAELAVDAEALSSTGLARFERLSIADGVEVETLAQLLKSPRLCAAAGAQVGGVTGREVEESIKVLSEQGSPIVKLKVTATAPAQARAVGRAIVEQAMKVDGERKQLRSREAIEAVKAQLADAGKQLDGLNGEIQQLTAGRAAALTHDPERQHRAALELSQLTQRLAALNVEGAALQQRGRRLAELIASLPAAGGMPSRADIEEADKSPGLAEARKRLFDQESEVAALRSRYGARHAKVEAAEAEVAATKKSLRELLGTQREVVQGLITDNTNAQKIIGEKIAATEAEARQSDFSLDPVQASLLTRRESLVATYGQLTGRVTELQVFAAARPATFYLFSDPTLPDRASLLRPAATFVAGAMLGVVLGFFHCLMLWKRVPEEHGISRPAYVAP